MESSQLARGFLILMASVTISACDGEAPRAAGSPYLPVAVGNRWVYDEVDEASGTVLATVTKEITGRETYAGVDTFVRLTTQTDGAAQKLTHWRLSGGRIIRLNQDVLDASGALVTSRVYDPGFLRFDSRLTEAGATLQEQHVRSEYNALGTLMAQKQKEYTWTVEAVDEEMTVPAGTFTCLRLHRVDADIGDEQFWFAKDVGIVKEDDGPQVEVLREYSVGD